MTNEQLINELDKYPKDAEVNIISDDIGQARSIIDVMLLRENMVVLI